MERAFKSKMNGIRELRRAAILLIFTISISGAFDKPASTNPDAPNDPVRIPTDTELRGYLQMLAIEFDAMKKMVALLPSMTAGDQATDVRGRTQAQDWQDYMLTTGLPAVVEKKRQEILGLIEQGRREQAKSEIDGLKNRLSDEASMGAAIAEYWKVMGEHPPDYAPYFAMLRANGIEPLYAANLESLDRTFTIEINHGLFTSAM